MIAEQEHGGVVAGRSQQMADSLVNGLIRGQQVGQQTLRLRLVICRMLGMQQML